MLPFCHKWCTLQNIFAPITAFPTLMLLAHSAPNKLGPLRDALSCGVMPCSSGIFPVKNEDLILFYGKSSSEPAR